MSKLNKEANILYLFHHLHHSSDIHEVHHCGEKHPATDYTINHCSCGLHRIDKQIANGDTIDENLNKRKVLIKFTEKCPQGGWHIESGQVLNS